MRENITNLGRGGIGYNGQVAGSVFKALQEMQGFTISMVTGAAAGTKMDIPAIRTEDTILSAQYSRGVTALAVAEATSLTVDATMGTYTITYGGQVTAPIAYNASAAAVQAALEALSNVAPGDVVVTGGPGSSGGGTPYTLTWATYLGNVTPPTTTVTDTLGKTAEVQSLAVDATAGTFTVTYAGQTTAAVAFNVSGANLTTAMDNLSNLIPGDVVVTGGPGVSGGGTPYTFTFRASMGNVAQITATDVSLTGGGDAITPSTTTAGVAGTAAIGTTTAGVQEAGSGFADDVANITIQSTNATGTITLSGLPLANDTVTVNAVVYTFKALADATKNTFVAIAASAALTGDNLAAKINLVENAGNAKVTAVSNGAGVVTLTSATAGVGSGAVVTDTGSTITINSTNPGAVTATLVSAGNNDAITVNGITYTIKTTPTDSDLHVAVALTDTLQAALLTAAINRYTSAFGRNDVVATSALGVITIVPSGGATGNSIGLSESASNLTVSGSGYLANGTATGGIKSTTDLTGEQLLVTWLNKTP